MALVYQIFVADQVLLNHAVGLGRFRLSHSNEFMNILQVLVTLWLDSVLCSVLQCNTA